MEPTCHAPPGLRVPGRSRPIRLKEKGAGPVPGRPEGEAQPAAQRDEVGPGRVLHCAHCGHPITRERDRTTVGGRHAYTRVNPYGIVYHFGCFSAAGGCSVTGPPSLEETWFPGHAWEVAGCARCTTHLGWRFRGERTFFGLLLERLRAGE